MCFGCSKEPSHQDGSFEYPKHMFWLRIRKKSSAYSYLEACCTISHVNLYSQSLTPAPLGFQSELFSKLKGRQSDSDMDEGLPSSPPRTSLTTADVILGGMFKVYNSFIVLDVLGRGLKVYSSFLILDDVLFTPPPFCVIAFSFVVAMAYMWCFQ